MKITGKDCPLLFDKWKPLEFQDFTLDDSGQKYQMIGKCKVNQSYTLPFAWVEINFDYNQYSRQEISANQIIPNEKYTDIPFIFNKEIFELYEDAKKFTQRQIDIAAKLNPEIKDLIVNKYSRFQRSINFEYTVNAPFEQVDLRNKTAIDIYLSIKEHLMNKFSKDKEFMHPGNIMGFEIGTDEAILLKNGININASGTPDELNAGTVYLTIYSDEKGSQKEFQNVFDEMTKIIYSKHRNKLNSFSDGSCLNFGIKGNGSSWRIDLPEIKQPRHLSGTNSGLVQLLESF